MSFEAYKRAEAMNDEAHGKSIRELDTPEWLEKTIAERQDRFREIQQEAKMWLKLLFSVHLKGEQ